MTVTELSVQLSNLGYNVPTTVLCSWPKGRVDRVYRYVRWRLHLTPPVGRPVVRPEILERFRIPPPPPPRPFGPRRDKVVWSLKEWGETPENGSAFGPRRDKVVWSLKEWGETPESGSA